MIVVSVNIIVIVGSVRKINVVNQNLSVGVNVLLFVVIVIENIGKIVHDFLFLLRNFKKVSFLVKKNETFLCYKKIPFSAQFYIDSMLFYERFFQMFQCKLLNKCFTLRFIM